MAAAGAEPMGSGNSDDEASAHSCAPPAPASKPTPNPKAAVLSGADEIRAVALKFAAQPLQVSEPGAWAVLTAISKPSRLRPQGMNIVLSGNSHCLGRCVKDPQFQIDDVCISASHCRIYRGETVPGEPNPNAPVFIKDTSTNGTYVNSTRLRKNTPPESLCHGDIVALSSPTQSENTYAFVYREVRSADYVVNGAAIQKRKSEEVGTESKRLRGLGIGSPDGPISLDDVRSLQRSNTELRQQLESHVQMVETLKASNRAAATRYENELKELKETAANSFLDQIKDLQQNLDGKQKELDSIGTSATELRNSIKDLNERLSASKQSRADADEIIQSQKATISELEERLDEERRMRRAEREKAAEDLKSALQKAHAEAQEEIKRQADVYLKQYREQQEVISKLQESEKETRLLVETLRSKLADTRESLVRSENKARQLEVQLQDEQLASTNIQKRFESLESEQRKLKEELENEKAAREEAWAKVSALELEVAASLRDLSIEKQRFQGARERLILRETQLRAFYSTTEEISSLFVKQQEQLKAMQRTLEDEENYENTLMGLDLNKTPPKNGIADAPGREETYSKKHREAASTSTKNMQETQDSSSDEGVSTTEKHRSGHGIEDGNTQDLECTSPDRSTKGFGSDIHGGGPPVAPDRDPTDTERVLETESQAGHAGSDEQNAALQTCSILGGETMQLDTEAQPQENDETQARDEVCEDGSSQAKHEDTETGTIRTDDLLASEVAGSWAMCTAPSVNGENESPGSLAHGGGGGNENAIAAAATAAADALMSDDQAAESQSNVGHGVAKLTAEHRVLNAMIEIVSPGFSRQLPGADGIKNDSMSDAETEEDSNDGDTGNSSDDDRGDDSHGGDASDNDATEAMIEDSVG